ncbi:MAG: hypothetical protein M1454_02745 [Candidatus Thermoplasmatota archaeon]|nr:hypothetical protein [Candidatus Thermoplasmatota archaeon]MCL5731531.1 hypothetical protein [Candidatus Thermoplasmatota archaeon]
MPENNYEPHEIIDYLTNLGMSEESVRIYLAILRLGNTAVGPLSRELSIDRGKIYRIIRYLQAMGVVEVVGGNPTKYWALGLNEAVSMMIRHQEERLNTIRSQKDQIMEKYGEIFRPRNEKENGPVRMKLSEGIQPTVNSINLMVSRAMNRIYVMLDHRNFMRIYSRRTIVEMGKVATKGIEIRMILPNTESLTEIIMEMRKAFSIRRTEIEKPLNFISVDSAHLLLLMESTQVLRQPTATPAITGVEISGTDISERFDVIFDRIWHDSDDI